MTKTILLALTLSLGSLSLSSSALACGGYGLPRVDPEVVAIRAAVLEYAAAHIGADTLNTVHSVRVNGGRATVVVRLERPEGRAYERDVRLVRRRGGWRVTGVGRRRLG